MRNRTMVRGITLATTAMLALALTAGSATAVKGGNGKSKGHKYGKIAAKQCAKDRKALGKSAFGEIHGKPAMPNCIGVKRGVVKSAGKSASKDCRAERNQLGAEAFANKYGSNKNKRNAFGKCVSKGMKPELNEDRANKVNAAAECRAERSDPNFAATHDGMTFDEFYGTNRNKKNAFGKCVSGKAKAKSTPEPTPTA